MAEKNSDLKQTLISLIKEANRGQKEGQVEEKMYSNKSQGQKGGREEKIMTIGNDIVTGKNGKERERKGKDGKEREKRERK